MPPLSHLLGFGVGLSIGSLCNRRLSVQIGVEGCAVYIRFQVFEAIHQTVAVCHLIAAIANTATLNLVCGSMRFSLSARFILCKSVSQFRLQPFPTSLKHFQAQSLSSQQRSVTV
jgi:hypothetical protein